MACELVTTGWYATDAGRSYMTQGDESIRGVAFRPLWWKSIDTFVRPEHVFIVDSAAPVKADESLYTSTKVRRLELLNNPGHSQNCTTHYCGAMAAIIMGLEFALHNDVELFLYVEQDALVFGDEIVEKTKSALRRKDLVFGPGNLNGVQQSFFAANKRGIRQFLSALHAIKYSDKQIAPEHKFMFAASSLLPSPLLALAEYTDIRKLRVLGEILFTAVCSLSKNYAVLPFGYGRDRPINFSDDVFYFQHGSAEELRRYRERTGF